VHEEAALTRTSEEQRRSRRFGAVRRWQVASNVWEWQNEVGVTRGGGSALGHGRGGSARTDSEEGEICSVAFVVEAEEELESAMGLAQCVC
jgi:hypothetical protein